VSDQEQVPVQLRLPSSHTHSSGRQGVNTQLHGAPRDVFKHPRADGTIELGEQGQGVLQRGVPGGRHAVRTASPSRSTPGIFFAHLGQMLLEDVRIGQLTGQRLKHLNLR
jgi:hypothetical protein